MTKGSEEGEILNSNKEQIEQNTGSLDKITSDKEGVTPRGLQLEVSNVGTRVFLSGTLLLPKST